MELLLKLFNSLIVHWFHRKWFSMAHIMEIQWVLSKHLLEKSGFLSVFPNSCSSHLKWFNLSRRVRLLICRALCLPALPQVASPASSYHSHILHFQNFLSSLKTRSKYYLLHYGYCWEECWWQYRLRLVILCHQPRSILLPHCFQSTRLVCLFIMFLFCWLLQSFMRLYLWLEFINPLKSMTIF